MRLVLGIGNPGARYEGTRHNVGFQVLNRVVESRGLAFKKESGFAMTADLDTGQRLMKPLTFVNRSGRALARQLEQCDIARQNILIVVDDVHLPLGRLRLRVGGTSGGHNGLKSVEQVLGSRDYPRLRMGVGSSDSSGDLVDHVLGPFEADELKRVEAVTERAAEAVIGFVEGQTLAELMGQYNQKG